MSLIHSFSETEKQISSGRALENLELSGTKIIMNGPIVCKLCDGGKTQKKYDP